MLNRWHWGPPGYHPSDNAEEWREYQQLKEIGYTEKKMHQGFLFIRTHRKLYVVQSLRRVVYLWTGFWNFNRGRVSQEPWDLLNVGLATSMTGLAGLGLWRFSVRLPRDLPYRLCVFPFYYLTRPEDYYRRPMIPLFVVLAAFAISSWRSGAEQKLVPGVHIRSSHNGNRN